MAKLYKGGNNIYGMWWTVKFAPLFGSRKTGGDRSLGLKQCDRVFQKSLGTGEKKCSQEENKNL